MTDKSFYQAAAAEVAGGQLDPALWIKVGSEMPTADSIARQARYIQLRAREMAAESAKRHLFAWCALNRWWHWAVLGSVLCGSAVLLLSIVSAGGTR
jgi:hypothetical protein